MSNVVGPAGYAVLPALYNNENKPTKVRSSCKREHAPHTICHSKCKSTSSHSRQPELQAAATAKQETTNCGESSPPADTCITHKANYALVRTKFSGACGSYRQHFSGRNRHGGPSPWRCGCGLRGRH